MKYILVVAGIFGLDGWLKERIDRKYQLGKKKRIGKSPVLIEKYYNTGATLNLLADKPGLMKGIHIAVMGLLSVLYIRLLGNGKHSGIDTGQKIGYSMMLGGGLSNLWDRIHKKHVVDYMRFDTPWRRFSSIVFNISDFFIFIGAAVAVLFSRK